VGKVLIFEIPVLRRCAEAMYLNKKSTLVKLEVIPMSRAEAALIQLFPNRQVPFSDSSSSTSILKFSEIELEPNVEVTTAEAENHDPLGVLADVLVRSGQLGLPRFTVSSIRRQNIPHMNFVCDSLFLMVITYTTTAHTSISAPAYNSFYENAEPRTLSLISSKSCTN
jgi:hypothetical protein